MASYLCVSILKQSQDNGPLVCSERILRLTHFSRRSEVRRSHANLCIKKTRYRPDVWYAEIHFVFLCLDQKSYALHLGILMEIACMADKQTYILCIGITNGLFALCVLCVTVSMNLCALMRSRCAGGIENYRTYVNRRQCDRIAFSFLLKDSLVDVRVFTYLLQQPSSWYRLGG